MEDQSSQLTVLLGPKLNSGVPLVTGSISIGFLNGRYQVPYRDARAKTGYQRNPSKARINKLKADLLRKRVDLPTAVLMNLRDPAAKEALVRGDHNGTWHLDLGPYNSRQPTRYGPFYVVDGQHRLVALQGLYDDDPDRWADFIIPFVCMLGGTERQEIEQFYVVNSTAKSVRTDLALDLLKQRAEASADVMEHLTERGEEWKVKAQALIDKLASASPLWRGLIRLPNEDKGQTVVTSAGLASSLKPLLATPYFGNVISEDNRVKILDAYWAGIQEVLPEPFQQPDAYSLQKGIGVHVMHQILINVLEILREKGASVIDADAYADVLRGPLENLEGETGSGDVVDGADFWLVAPRGAAGSFSSSAGRRVLTARLKNLLEPVSIE